MIKIDEEYFIDADERQYFLSTKIGVDKKGKPVFRHSRFHPKLEDLIESLIDERVRLLIHETDGTKEDFKTRLMELKDWVEDLLERSGYIVRVEIINSKLRKAV